MFTEPRPVQVLIVSYSRLGALTVLAERIAEGARQVGETDVQLLDVPDESLDQRGPAESGADVVRRRSVILNRLSSADALIVGAPAYFGSMAAAVKRLFEEVLVTNPSRDRSRPWREHLFRDKVGAAFTSSGTPHGGNEMALHSILTLFMHLGMVVVTPGQGEPILENPSAPYGATAVVGPGGDQTPSPVEQEAARALGRRVAELTTYLHLGRTDWEKLHGQTPSNR